MSILTVVLGLSILIIAMIDVLVTTLTADGGGPITHRVSCLLWRIALRVHCQSSNHQVLVIAGWIILVNTALLWIFMTWVGWALLFNAVDTSIVSSQTKQPANVWEKIYFTGYTLSTLGLGDYQPQGTVWQIATVVASTNGFLLTSLSIAYLLPVVSAATAKRVLALYIASLGGTPDQILVRAWNGKAFQQLDQHLITLTSMVIKIGENHLNYPMLHYFHSPNRTRSLPLSLVALDEALTMLQYGVKESYRPAPAVLGAARRATAAFLKTLKSAYIEPAGENPPPPPLELLQAKGIPTISEQEFWAAIKNTNSRRRLLLALVKKDGWNWDAVASSKTTNRASSLDDY